MEIVIPYAYVVLIHPCSLWQVDSSHTNIFTEYMYGTREIYS